MPKPRGGWDVWEEMRLMRGTVSHTGNNLLSLGSILMNENAYAERGKVSQNRSENTNSGSVKAKEKLALTVPVKYHQPLCLKISLMCFFFFHSR